jgi:hypothetical protein
MVRIALARSVTPLRVDDACWRLEAGHDAQRAVLGVGPGGEAGSVLVPGAVKVGELCHLLVNEFSE